jgi:site-specific recombinase XerD
MNDDNFYPRVWRPALKGAAIKNLRIHDLWHTFCSRLVGLGVGLRAVQLLAGHKSFATTERYAHLTPGQLSDAVEMLAR